MNPEFDILDSPIAPGLSVIEASAGTGKTYAISHLVPRFLLEGTAEDLSQILLVTFTKDAAGELSDRTRQVLECLHAPPDPDEPTTRPILHAMREKFGEDRIRNVIGQALLDLDRLAVSTIHSFCMTTLQTEGALCGFPVVPELIPDASDLLEEAIADEWEVCVSGNETAAALAAENKWRIESATKAVRTILQEKEPRFSPEAVGFPEFLRSLESLCRGFPTREIPALEALIVSVPKWKSGAPPQEEWQAALEALKISKDFLSVFRASEILLLLAKNINRKGKDAASLALTIKNHPLTQAAQDLITQAHSAEWHLHIHIAGKTRDIVASKLAANRQITYDGLITAVRDALRNKGATLADSLRKRHRIALIDESQDTDPAQFEIFSRIFLDNAPNHKLILIGDPKQAIYAFRGADVNTYLQARSQAEGRTFSLTKTFRAPQPLVQAVNAIFQRKHAFLNEGITFAPAESGLSDRWLADPALEKNDAARRLEAWVVPNADPAFSSEKKRNARIAALVATEIVRLLNQKATIHSEDATRPHPVEPGDFAVLVSEHKQGVAVAEALRARGVPAIRAEDGDIMDTEEARDLLILLRALREPRRTGLRRAALATRYFGKTASALDPAQDATADYATKFTEWAALWDAQGLSAALSSLDKSERIALRLAEQTGGERRVTNFRQLCDLLEAASHEIRGDPARLIAWFARAVAEAEGRTAIEERQQQLETDRDAVQIVTMHLAKGLEYPLVFCPFLWTTKKLQGIQRIPSQSPSAPPLEPGLLFHANLVGEAAPEIRLRQRADLEDRLRLAYVALTRAQVKAWILAGETGSGKSPSALDWLLRDDPDQLFELWSDVSTKRGERHERVLAECGSASGGALSCRPLPEITDDPWSSDAAESPSELAAEAAPEIPPPWGFTSFSALTREKSPHAPQGEWEGPGIPTEASANPFLSAPGGAAMGTIVHEWIEGWDFQSVDTLRSASLISGLHRTEPDITERITAMLGILRTTRLPGLEASVAEACPDPKASEWHFQLPIRDSLSPQALASVFGKHGLSEYARQLAILPAKALQGYLHGFLDRIAFWKGVWGVIDWKTNLLGLTPEDYSEEALRRCAMESHYFLQTHLYLVALRRFLGPETPLAGAWLIFLRGIQRGTAEGVLHIHPARELLRDLDHLFGGTNS